ncbi:MAG TPA: MFS transporter [Caulobacteraceae bacterium]|nr:MFS transporter [Caulobacteraceae bacterium]
MRTGTLVICLLALGIFINYVDRGNLSTASPVLKNEFNLNATQIGLLTSAFSWTYVAAMPLAGWLSEKIGGYRTLALGLAIWSLATLLTGFAGGFAAILVLRLVLGIGESAAFPCSSKIIAERVEPRRLGLANSMMSLGLSLGPAFGVFFGGHLIAQTGWRWLFLLFGGVSLAWLVPWIALTWRTPSHHQIDGGSGRSVSFLEIVGRLEFWGLSIAHLAGNYGFYFVISWLPLYLTQVHHLSMARMGNLSGFIYLAYAAAAAIGALATDAWVSSGATHGTARKTIAAVSMLAAAFGLVVTALGADKVAVAGLFIAAVGLGAVSPHIFASAQRLAGPRAIGRWMGLQNCLGNFSGIVGPLITGYLIDKTGGFTSAFVLTAVVSLAGLVGWLVMIRRIEPLTWGASPPAENLSL